MPPVRKPSKEIEHCVSCHGPDIPNQKAMAWNQQGHMECVMCRADHTKAPAASISRCAPATRTSSTLAAP
jgi:hypothetical protein